MNLLQRTMRRRLFRVGVTVFAIGCGPLLLIIAASAFGITSDPNPNPVGLGILAMLTFWPSLLMMAIAAWQAWRSGEAAAP